jgi:hypothetical protein
LSCKARAQTRSLWEKGKKRRRERSKPPPFANPCKPYREKKRFAPHEGKKERERTASLFLPFGAVKNHFSEKKGM